MNLIKDKWTKDDIKEFVKYLETFQRKDKIEWTTNIINTKLPVLAILSPELKKITKQIMKGNYLSFLDLDLNDYYECMAINSIIISNIKNFETKKKYLLKYSKKIENWASCDSLKFDTEGKEQEHYKLSEYYLKSKLPFERRLGLYILFNFIDNDSYINKIYEIMDRFYNEEEYYVNMMNAWLLCELFTKRRNETIKYLEKNKLNKFTINKGISKCRDSYRVSKEDKEFLLKFKK